MTLVPSSTHWGAFVRSSRTATSSTSRAIPTTPTRRRCSATSSTASAIAARVARPAVAAGLARERARAPTSGAAPTSSSRSTGTRRSTWSPASSQRVRDAARQRSDLRRLVRLGQRRPLPSRAEPAAPLPQLHRWLHASVNTYSHGASEVILPHVVGGAAYEVLRRAPTWNAILEHTELVVAFGGMNREERLPSAGRGDPSHARRRASSEAGGVGLEFELFSPLRDRPAARCRRRRGTPVVPGHRHRGHARRSPTCCVREGLHDPDFLDRYTVGADRLDRLRARATPTASPKDPEWAAALSRDPGRRRSATWPAAWRAAARSSPSAGRCSGPSTASSRCGWASRWRRCSARSACPAAGSATATGRWPTSASPTVPASAADVPARVATRSTPTSRSPRSADLLEHPGGDARLQRRAATAARHPARLLGRRQPVPPPPGPQPAAPRVRAARHDRRARAVLDGDGPPRRHRVADHDDARARRHRRRPQRRLRHRDAPGARRRSARPATTTRSFAELAKRLGVWDEFTEGRTAREWVEHLYDDVPRAASRERGVDVPAVRRVLGRAARPGCRPTRSDHTLFDRFRADPDGRTARDAERSHRAVLRDDRRRSATTTAPVTRRGSSPTSGWAAREPSRSRCT